MEAIYGRNYLDVPETGSVSGFAAAVGLLPGILGTELLEGFAVSITASVAFSFTIPVALSVMLGWFETEAGAGLVSVEVTVGAVVSPFCVKDSAGGWGSFALLASVFSTGKRLPSSNVTMTGRWIGCVANAIFQAFSLGSSGRDYPVFIRVSALPIAARRSRKDLFATLPA